MSNLFPTYQRWSIQPLKAKGAWMTSTENKKYLDFTSGIGVLNLGHRHQKIEEAVIEQLNKYWHISNLFPQSIQEEVAKLLCDASGLDYVFFANSGAEANEAAIKLARKATGRSKIVTCLQSFHGRTFATMAATGQEKVRNGYGKMLESFSYCAFNHVEDLYKNVDEETAAIMIEIVQGEGGVHPATEEFLQAVQSVAKKFGALLIVDEIQTGIGRTGKTFAFQHFPIKPDIITVAKGLGNGLPIGAMLGRKEWKEVFGPGSHGSTFGGNPVSLAAAKAVLSIVTSKDFLEGVIDKGEYMKSELQNRLKGQSTIKEVRGLGLMIGIELTEQAAPYLEALQKEGLLTLVAGPNVLRLLPPLTVTREEMDCAISKICEILIHFEKTALTS